MTSAAGAADFPRDGLPEVAIVGRSNVGKSSLINALARQTIARTSAAPGKTRLANYYRLRRGTWPPMYLVDLPGYGYAQAPRHKGQRSSQEAREAATRDFDRLIDAYLARTEKPIGAVLLVDSRHPGLESDRDAWEWLRTLPFPRGVVGTKVDKLTRTERVRNTRQLESLFDVPVLLVSAQTGEGLEELWKLIARLPSQTAA